MAQEKLIIGSKFEIDGIHYRDGSEFEDAPFVVLHSISTRKYFGVSATWDDDNDVYKVTFPATMTNKMSEGSYDLEIYADSNRDNLIADIIEDYCYAVHGSGSSYTSNGNA